MSENESEDNTQVADAGVPGQIQYPEREVDAERAAAFAAGKEEFLNPADEDEDEPRSAHQRDIDKSLAPEDETAEEEDEEEA